MFKEILNIYITSLCCYNFCITHRIHCSKLIVGCYCVKCCGKEVGWCRPCQYRLSLMSLGERAGLLGECGWDGWGVVVAPRVPSIWDRITNITQGGVPHSRQRRWSLITHVIVGSRLNTQTHLSLIIKTTVPDKQLKGLVGNMPLS